jgi:hypothetical protein
MEELGIIVMAVSRDNAPLSGVYYRKQRGQDGSPVRNELRPL